MSDDTLSFGDVFSKADTPSAQTKETKEIKPKEIEISTDESPKETMHDLENHLLADMRISFGENDLFEDDDSGDVQAKLEEIRQRKKAEEEKEMKEKQKLQDQLKQAQKQIAAMKLQSAEKKKKQNLTVLFPHRELGLYIVQGNRCFVVSNVGRGTTAHLGGIYPNMIIKKITYQGKLVKASSLHELQAKLRNPALRPLTMSFIKPATARN